MMNLEAWIPPNSWDFGEMFTAKIYRRSFMFKTKISLISKVYQIIAIIKLNVSKFRRMVISSPVEINRECFVSIQQKVSKKNSKFKLMIRKY